MRQPFLRRYMATSLTIHRFALSEHPGNGDIFAVLLRICQKAMYSIRWTLKLQTFASPVASSVNILCTSPSYKRRWPSHQAPSAQEKRYSTQPLLITVKKHQHRAHSLVPQSTLSTYYAMQSLACCPLQSQNTRTDLILHSPSVTPPLPTIYVCVYS